MTIKRSWLGWTTPVNADKYRVLLHDQVFPCIEAKKVFLAIYELNYFVESTRMRLNL